MTPEWTGGKRRFENATSGESSSWRSFNISHGEVPPPQPLLRPVEPLASDGPDIDGFRLECASPSNHSPPGARPSTFAREPRCQDANCWHYPSLVSDRV